MVAKGKAWAAWSLVSGTAPTEIDDGIEFTAPGKITLPHDARYSWDPDVADFVGDPAPHQVKRAKWVLYLDTDDTEIVFTLYQRTGEFAKVHFKSWTPPTAHYAVWNFWIEWQNANDGVGYDTSYDVMREVIADKYESGKAIEYQNAAAIGPGVFSGYTGADTAFGTFFPVLTWSPVMAGAAPIVPLPVGGAQFPATAGEFPIYPATAPADDDEISIELVSGAARVINLELYHDWQQDVGPFAAENGDQCPGGVEPDEDSTTCAGLVSDSGPLRNSIPNALELELPTLEANPAWNGVTSPCATCDTGGGDTILLYNTPDRSYTIPAPDTLCTFAYDGADKVFGCHTIDTNRALLYPWTDGTSGDSPFAGIDYEGFTFRFATDLAPSFDGSTNPLASHLAVNGLDAVRYFNMALLIDHGDTSGAMIWETALTDSVNACYLPGGDYVRFRLPSVFGFGDDA